MITKRSLCSWVKMLMTCGLGIAWYSAGHAALPPDFPGIEVRKYNAAAVDEGNIFLAVATETPGIGTYLILLQNDGTPVWYRKLDTHEIYDFKVQPNGYLTYSPFLYAHTYTGGGDAVHDILDESFNVKETVTGMNGYVAESHDFQILPNGNVLQFGYYMSQVDVSAFLPGGHPAALVSGAIAQELDSQRNVVFQWRSWDHYDFEDLVTSVNPVISMFHFNTIGLDIDGHLIVGTPEWVKKINRQTSEVMWHLGGPENEFTFVGVTPQQGAAHFGGHTIHRIKNGNFLIYDNAPRQGAGTSQVHEYTLDETNKVATHVWTWAPSEPVRAWHRGSVQRLPNGNTFIGWGGATGTGQHIPACTEVTPAGEVVFEVYFASNNPPVGSYRAYKFPYPPSTQAVEVSRFEIANGNSYHFTNDTAVTGVRLDVTERTGSGYNEITVVREPYAPLYPVFSSKAPRPLPTRIVVRQSGIQSITGYFAIETDTLEFARPELLTIYHRETPGQGLFVPLTTTYIPAAGILRAPITRFGEYIIAYPDLPDVAYPALLANAENYRGPQPTMPIAPRLAVAGRIDTVNQELPILLSWSPKGMARWYQLQISTNLDFSATAVDVPYQTEEFFVWSNAVPGTLYHYRVKTHNEGGESEWAQGSFQTVPPGIELTSPNGGEGWQRGLTYFIRWNDNLAEEIVLELYKDGVLLRTLATNASTGAFQWEAPMDIAPGGGYAIRVRSATNSAAADVSDASFGFDLPSIVPGSVSRLADGRVQFTVSAPGVSEVTVLNTPDLQTGAWQEVQSLSLTNGSGVFTEETASEGPRRFYRIRVP